MTNPFTVMIDHEPIKFTPDGKVDVLDAITSLSGKNNKQNVWELLLRQRPELSDLCEKYHFSPHHSALVTDGQGWETIQTALFDYLVEAY